MEKFFEEIIGYLETAKLFHKATQRKLKATQRFYLTRSYNLKLLQSQLAEDIL